MRFALDDLPHDTATLHRLVRYMAASLDHRDGEVARLGQIIKELQRMRFGRRSERLDPDQLALGLEDLDADVAAVEESRPVPTKPSAGARLRRKALPEHLVREDVVHDVAGSICPGCGGALHSIGESVSETLDWVPASVRVLRISRPKYACRRCETVVQAPAPERLVAGGLPTPPIRPLRYSIRGAGGPRPGGAGSTRGTTGVGRDPNRRRRSSSSNPTAGPNDRKPTSPTTVAPCTSMAMQGSNG